MKKPGCTAIIPAGDQEAELLLVRVKQNLLEDVAFDSAANRFRQVMPGFGYFNGFVIHYGRGVLAEHQPGWIDVQDLCDFVNFSRAQAFAVFNLLNDGLIGAGAQSQFLLRPASLPSFSA